MSILSIEITAVNYDGFFYPKVCGLTANIGIFFINKLGGTKWHT
ncbi:MULTISPECIES: hypothetical protein [Psychrilyobacter]|nr:MULTISPECIES: hypothetical protein [Psychrilyobacter]